MSKESLKGKRIIPWFIGAALVEFLLYYIVSLFVYDPDIFYYYLYFAERFILLSIPVTAAAIIIRCATTRRDAVKIATFISLTRLVAFVPFFYVEYVYGPYDSIEAIILSLLSSLGAVVIYLLLILAVYALLRYLMKNRKNVEYPVRIFDLGAPPARAIFIASLIIFIINLLFEIYSTVLFLVENGTIYYIDEIVLMFCSYVFLAILLVGVHALGVIAINRAINEEE